MNNNYNVEPKKKNGASKKNNSEMIVNLGLVACAILSMVFLALTKTIVFFGPKNPSVIYGIFSILVFGLSIVGTALSYLVKRGKPSVELFLNAGVFVVALLTLAR